MQYFKLWIFGSNNNPYIFGTFDYKSGLQVQLVCAMLIPLLHALLSPFANQLLNITFVLLLAPLFFGDLFFTRKLSDLEYYSLHVLMSLAD